MFKRLILLCMVWILALPLAANSEDTDDVQPTPVRRSYEVMHNTTLSQQFDLPDAGVIFQYAPEWVTETLPGGVVTLSDGAHTIRFYGQTYLASHSLEDISTLNELAADLALILGDYTIQDFVLLKFDGRAAAEFYAVDADGQPLTLWTVTFSDGRLGAISIDSHDPVILNEWVYPVAATFDIYLPVIGDLDNVFIAGDMTHTFNYPDNWTLTYPDDQTYITISDGLIAFNLYTGDALQTLGLGGVDNPVILCEMVIEMVGWQAEPASRLRIDNRAAARILYENPVFDAEGRLYAIYLDNHTRQLGYVDVVALSPVANPDIYEALIFDLLASWRIVDVPGV